MTPQEAIDIFNEHLSFYRHSEDECFTDALQLGIEALKAIQTYRQGPMAYLYLPLPGETKE